MEIMNAMVLGAADGMTGLENFFVGVLAWAQRLGLPGAGISFCIGGYYLMWGGQNGTQVAKRWFIGAAVGLVVVMGAAGIAAGINQNINFGG